jgi:predicted DsbA family dithiol-disulfide isomerase
MSQQEIRIDYFTDILCVWAHVSQARIDELKKQFGSEIKIHYYFIPVFGCVKNRIEEGWKEKGGYLGFNEHVQNVCKQFPHTEVCADLWKVTQPATSLTSHHFLKSVQLLEDKSIISDRQESRFEGKTLFEEAVWQVRLAFFRDHKNIAEQAVLIEVADALSLPIDQLLKQMANGEALAALFRDMELRDQYRVEGSPTYVLNDGRQKLYGNIGYKVIEANVREIMTRPNEYCASWC